MYPLIDAERTHAVYIKMDFEVERMEPLFATEEDYQAFQDRHAEHTGKRLATFHR